MKKLLIIGLSLLATSALAAQTVATAVANSNIPTPDTAIINTNTATANVPSALIPPPPNLNAKSYVLMDANSGKIIAQKNMNLTLPPASLTKLMTIYLTEKALAQGQIHLTDKVRVSKHAWSRGGSRMFLKLGSHVPVSKLIQGVIVASGNDACVTLAEYIAGNEDSFASLMNQMAARLDMTNTHYVDSTGLPRPNHHSTAHDLAVLARHVITDYPQYYHFFDEKWINYNHIRQPNRNRLLWRDPGVDGLKTGHTKAAGYCLIASGVRHGMRLVSVVMGTPSDSARNNESQSLLNWGFRFYNTRRVFSANTAIAQPRIWLGQMKTVPMGITKDLHVSFPAGQYNQLKATMHLTPNLKAPIVQGQSYGTVTLTLAGKVLTTTPLVALKNDPLGGFWSRMTDHVAMFFR